MNLSLLPPAPTIKLLPTWSLHLLTYTCSSPASGNYDTFKKTVADNEVVQQKKYEKEQEDIKHIKEFIASCGAS